MERQCTVVNPAQADKSLPRKKKKKKRRPLPTPQSRRKTMQTGEKSPTPGTSPGTSGSALRRSVSANMRTRFPLTGLAVNRLRLALEAELIRVFGDRLTISVADSPAMCGCGSKQLGFWWQLSRLSETLMKFHLLLGPGSYRQVPAFWRFMTRRWKYNSTAVRVRAGRQVANAKHLLLWYPARAEKTAACWYNVLEICRFLDRELEFCAEQPRGCLPRLTTIDQVRGLGPRTHSN